MQDSFRGLYFIWIIVSYIIIMTENTHVLKNTITDSDQPKSDDTFSYFDLRGKCVTCSDVSGKSDSGSDVSEKSDSYASFGIPSRGHYSDGSIIHKYDNSTCHEYKTTRGASLEKNTDESCDRTSGCSGPHVNPDSPSNSIQSGFNTTFRQAPMINTKQNYSKHDLTSSCQNVEVVSPTRSKTSHRRRNLTLLKIVVTCAIFAAVVAGVLQYNKFGTDSDMNISPKTPEALTCVKSDQLALVSLGNQVCYSNFYIANSSKLFSIHMNLISSNYKPLEASIFVNSSEFVGKLGDWIVDYNISRMDSLLRVTQQHVTCQSNGTYQLLLQYENGLNTTTEFEVRISDPKLEQTFTYIDDKILVTCELTEACVASSLALYGSSGGYSYLIPSEDTCSQTFEANGTNVLLKASVPKSSISEGETISCVPIMTMTDQELVKNLTKAVTFCKDRGCEPDCKTIPDYGLYYPDRIYCNIFYQCDDGRPVVRPCGKDTYWEPSMCTF